MTQTPQRGMITLEPPASPGPARGSAGQSAASPADSKAGPVAGTRGLRAYVATPSTATSGAGPWPGVVMIHEAWGLDDVLRRQADHLASRGYLVIAPDLFTGGGMARCLVPTFMAMRKGEGPAFADIEACRRWLLDSAQCTGKTGIIGFCMGGGFALMTATRGFDAAAPCYGMLPKTPQELIGAAPIVASYGAEDASLSGCAAKLERALTAYDIPHDVKEYAGAGHSFMNDEDNSPLLLRPLMKVQGAGPDPVAAADAWQRIDAFFSDHLA